MSGTNPAPPTATQLHYLNEYETNRSYGGPEEGGWWYNTGHFILCHGTYPSRDAAASALERLAPELARRRADLHPPSSVLCNGWPEIRIERHSGADSPASPRYE